MQKFNKYDLVHISKDLGNSMHHFQSDRDAIVIGSYADQYGGNNDDSYTLFIQGMGEVSWYRAGQLTLIEKNRSDLLEEWKLEIERERSLKGDLDWVFANGNEVLTIAHGASIQALANCFGLMDLWGNGEGITYYANAMNTIAMARPYLESGDKTGWIEYCKDFRGGKSMRDWQVVYETGIFCPEDPQYVSEWRKVGIRFEDRIVWFGVLPAHAKNKADFWAAEALCKEIVSMGNLAR